MNRHPAVLYIILGVCIMEALVWCILQPWMHHRFTTGFATDHVWKPVLWLAVVGALLGIATFAARSALKGR